MLYLNLCAYGVQWLSATWHTYLIDLLRYDNRSQLLVPQTSTSSTYVTHLVNSDPTWAIPTSSHPYSLIRLAKMERGGVKIPWKYLSWFKSDKKHHHHYSLLGYWNHDFKWKFTSSKYEMIFIEYFPAHSFLLFV